MITARVTPIPEFKPIMITERGRLLGVRGLSAVSNLPLHIAERQKGQAIKHLSRQNINAQIEIGAAPSPGKGSFLFLVAQFENVLAGFSSLGAIGKRAEEVADEACQELIQYYDRTGALDSHLADQVIPCLALTRGRSECAISRITQHLLTNIQVVKQFTDADIRIEGAEGEEGRVNIILL